MLLRFPGAFYQLMYTVTSHIVQTDQRELASGVISVAIGIGLFAGNVSSG